LEQYNNITYNMLYSSEVHHNKQLFTGDGSLFLSGFYQKIEKKTVPKDVPTTLYLH